MRTSSLIQSGDRSVYKNFLLASFVAKIYTIDQQSRIPEPLTNPLRALDLIGLVP